MLVYSLTYPNLNSRLRAGYIAANTSLNFSRTDFCTAEEIL